MKINFQQLILIKNLQLRCRFSFISDPDRIQTCNPQSRNLIFYSVELRGQFIFVIPAKAGI